MEGNSSSSDDNIGEEGNQNDNTESNTGRTLNFTVNDGTDPVSGATVTIGETTSTTGSAGGCSLTNILDGEHTVTVTKEGYTEYTDTITVSEENTNFTISLTSI